MPRGNGALPPAPRPCFTGPQTGRKGGRSMQRPNCREVRGHLIESARSASLAPYFGTHLAQCPECARLLERQNALSRSLGDLKDGYNPQTIPPRIEAAPHAV